VNNYLYILSTLLRCRQGRRR